jgi:hypothetical protein
MTSYALDNSVAMRWLLASNKTSDQRYAESVLKSLVSAEAIVPNLWHLEAANLLLGATTRKDIESAGKHNPKDKEQLVEHIVSSIYAVLGSVEMRL